MRNVLIAALLVLGPAAASAQNSNGVFSNKYLQDQINNSKDKTEVQQMDFDICIEVVSDFGVVMESEGWKSVTETSTPDQLTILLSKGKKRERMTCYKDQLIVDKWKSTLK